MYVLELKRWSGEAYHEKGLMQLGQYLEQYSLNEGYLLIFDFRRVNGEAEAVKETTLNLGDKEKSLPCTSCESCIINDGGLYIFHFC